MREELVRAGIKETRTAEEVDAALAEPGTTLVVVNSICGCAAGKARPGIRLALSNTPTSPIARSPSLPARTARRRNAPAATLKAIRPARPLSPFCATASSSTLMQRAVIEQSTAQAHRRRTHARLRRILREDHGVGDIQTLRMGPG
jgi:putative YphP/YqiW family bacilliredoxin